MPEGGPQVSNARFEASGLEVDNGNPNDVWLYGDQGLAHSTDGGLTFRFRDLLSGVPVSSIDVTTLGAGQRVAAGRKDAAVAEYSLIGRPFEPIRVPGVVNSIASPPAPLDMFAAAHSQGVTMVIPECRKNFDISPPDGANLFSLSAASSVGTPLVGRTEGFIYTRPIGGDEMLAWYNECIGTVPDVLIPAVLPPLLPPDEQPGLLEPQNKKIVLERGESKTVDYRFELPPFPNPLDVHFLIDVSDSMSEEINGIRAAMADIVTDMNEAGIDVWFGVGQYRSYEDDPAYDRVRDVGPPDGGLVSALNELQALGGGDETQLAALLQVATGEGQNGPGLARIVPGLDSHWRPGSLRVIIHATDEVFSTGGSHPTFENVAGGLLADEIMQAGIAIQDAAAMLQDPLVDTPLDGLTRVARDSHAVAQGDGLDCDGDGNPEIPPGEELVCVVDPADSDEATVMGPAVINVLRSLVDVGGIQTAPSIEGSIERGDEVVSAITPRVILDLNFKERNEFEFSVTYKCPALKKQDRFPVDIVVSREAGPLGTARALVVCEVPTKPPTRDPRELLLVPALLPPLIPLGPAAPQPPEPPPNTRPNPQPQGQTQAQAQGAMATQEEKEPQLAFAAAAHEEAEAMLAGNKVTEEYAMSGYRDKRSGTRPTVPDDAGGRVPHLHVRLRKLGASARQDRASQALVSLENQERNMSETTTPEAHKPSPLTKAKRAYKNYRLRRRRANSSRRKSSGRGLTYILVIVLVGLFGAMWWSIDYTAPVSEGEEIDLTQLLALAEENRIQEATFDDWDDRLEGTFVVKPVIEQPEPKQEKAKDAKGEDAKGEDAKGEAGSQGEDGGGENENAPQNENEGDNANAAGASGAKDENSKKDDAKAEEAKEKPSRR